MARANTTKRKAAPPKPKKSSGGRATSPTKRSTKPQRAIRRSGSSNRVAARHALELDWSAVCEQDNGRSFENLGLDLFEATYGSAKLVPNATRPGRDGGADGLFLGEIADIEGPWKIACAVRSKFSTAMTKVKQENKLAREAGQPALMFITSFDATPSQTLALTAAARKGLDGAVVWTQSTMTRMLRDHPWLRQLYFGHELIPGFVPVQHSANRDGANQPDIELLGRDDVMTALCAHLSGKGRIAVVEGPGGAGKSRLLRALPTFLDEIRCPRSVWLRRPGIGTVAESLGAGLPIRKPMVLVLDDAGQALADLNELVHVAVDRNVDAKLVIAIRSADRDAVLERLGAHRAGIQWVDLEQLRIDEAVRIVQYECRRISASDAKRLATAFGSNLYLLRAAAQLLDKGETPRAVVDDAYIRSLVARRLTDESTAHLGAHMAAAEVPLFLAELALTVPITRAAVVADDRLETLRHAGVLRTVGNTLRFRSDVEGDILLAHLAETPSTRATLERIIEEQIESESLGALLRNLGAAGQGFAASIIRRIVRRWRAEPGLLRSSRRLLRLLPRCARAATDETTELVSYFASSLSLQADDVGPTILAVGDVDAAKGLDLAGRVASAGFEPGRYSDYQARSLCQRILNPYRHDVAELERACDVIGRWAEGPVSEQLGQLIEAALATLFSPVARWDTSDANSITFHEKELPAIPPLLELRQRATSLLRRMFEHQDRRVRVHAIAIASSQGSRNPGRVSTRAFDAAALEEFESLVPILRERLDVEQDIEVWFRLYELLAHRWAAALPGDAAAAELLRGRDADPLVKAFHFASNQSEWFWSFDEAVAASPTERDQRWRWWVRAFLSGRAVPGERERVVEALCTRYGDPEGVILCATALSGADNPTPVLDAWCRRSPNAFRIAAERATTEQVRVLLGRALRRHRYNCDPASAVADLVRLPQPLDPSEVDAITNEVYPGPQHALSMARFLAESEQVEIRRRGLQLLEHRSDVDASLALDVLVVALRDGRWGRYWPLIWSTLHATERLALLDDRDDVRAHVERILLDECDDGGNDWYEQQVCNQLYASNLDGRLSMLARLFERDGYGSTRNLGTLTLPLFDDPKTFRLLAEHMVEWVRTSGEVGISKLQTILTYLRRRDLPDSTLEIAMSFVSSDDAQRRKVGLVLLSQLRENVDACCLLAEVATEAPSEVQQLAMRGLQSFRRPRGVYGRAIGEPAPAMLAIRGTLQEAHARASKRAKLLLAEVLAQLDANLDEERREDEEDLEPH